MPVLNKGGLTISYAKDLKDSKLARQLWSSIGIKSVLENTQSNMHWIESDNLETMLKSTSIHNAERLTHFLTSQLEYVDGLHCVVDLFPKRAEHMIPSSKFHLSGKEETSYFVFLQLCIEKVSQLHITLACDDKIKALAQSNDIDNTSINPFQLTQQKCMPCERILKREDNFPQTSTVYLRMVQLCSNDIYDIRKLLDLTANDHSVNELSYLPTVAFSPRLFASELINRAKISGNDKPNEMTPQPPYFVQWGFVEFPKDKYDNISLPKSDKFIQKIIFSIVEKLKGQKESSFVCEKLVEKTISFLELHPESCTQIDHIMFIVIHGELLRKLGFLRKAAALLLPAKSDLDSERALNPIPFYSILLL